jgi:hypothetical protein
MTGRTLGLFWAGLLIAPRRKSRILYRLRSRGSSKQEYSVRNQTQNP